MAYNHGTTYSLRETGSPGQGTDDYSTISQHQAQQSHLSGLGHQGDSAPSSQQRSLYYKFVRLGVRFSEWWLPEITSFLIALGLVGLHVWLLLEYDRQPVSSWTENNIGSVLGFTTLQSVVSLLSTLMRGAIFFPVASAIGQWKWHKYRGGKPQSLDELDHFDKASRGITGSIGYLFSGNFWSPASLGCVIMISGIFFGPSLQNSVSTTPSYSLANFTASLPVARNFDSYGTRGQSFDQPSLLVASPVMQASIVGGWAFGMSAGTVYTTRSNDVFPTCPGSSCKWDEWSSLDLNSWCETAPVDRGFDASFSAAANVSTSRLVNGTTKETILNMAALESPPETSYFFTDLQPLAVLAHVGIIGDPGIEGTDVEAVECILYWQAIQGRSISYNGNVTDDDTLNTSIIWQSGGLESDHDSWGYHNVTFQVPWSCGSAAASTDSGSSLEDSCNHTATDRAQRGLFNSLRAYFTGHGIIELDEDSGETVWQGSDPANDLFMWDWSSELKARSSDDPPLLATAKRHMTNLAWSISTRIRMDTETPSYGSVWVLEEHFDVQLHYLIPPGVVMALSIIFFIVAAICTRRDNVWRNSQLPLLYHGLEQTGPKEWRNKRMTAMWEAAYDARVKLETDVNDGGLKLHRYTDVGGKSGKGEYSRVAATPEVVEQTFIMGGKPV